MEPQHLTTYINLVQQLFRCPKGEEWNLFRENEAWVNTELIDVMEQLAYYLNDVGQVPSATYLSSWIDELHRILIFVTPKPSSQATVKIYADLIQMLLSYPKEKQDKILQENSTLMHPQLAKMMQQIAAQFYRADSPDTADFLNNLAKKVNRAWVDIHNVQLNLEKTRQIAPKPFNSKMPPTKILEQKPIALTQASAEIPTKISSSPEPKISLDNDVGTQLAALEKTVGALGKDVRAIVTGLKQIEEVLSRYLQSNNPLEYQAVLEQAAIAGWIISSTEVEQLIGVKPSCNKGETTYQRGNWQFVKAGKIGTQTGWRVEKLIGSS